jgi:hypothetical protein
MLERGERRFERRGLLEDLANALGCAVIDLTGEPYLPGDRVSAEALATLPPISIALFDTTLDDVPDVPARPVDELASSAGSAISSDPSGTVQLLVIGGSIGPDIQDIRSHRAVS